MIEFTRQALLEQAQHQGLLSPDVVLTLPAVVPARPPCPAGWDIAAQDLRNLLHVRVVARCADGKTPAQDYLLRATLSADVLVMARAVAAGKALSDEDVELQHRDISLVTDAVSNLDGLAETTPRTALRVGQLLQQRLMQAMVLVKRGDAVRIVARRDGLEVQSSGEAQDAGARGATVRVRNVASGRVISARVIDPGVVEPADTPPH